MNIKINRAYRLCSDIHQPHVSNAISTIPTDVLARLSASQIAALVRVIHDRWVQGQVDADRSTCAEGYVWDTQRQRGREVPL